MNLIQINPINSSSQWDEAIKNSSSPQFFHLSCWLKTLVDTYKFKPLCFTLQSDQNCTIPVLITRTLTGKKKAIALPFSDGSDIDCKKLPHDELVGKLLKIAKKEKCYSLEFRGTSTFRPSGEPSHSYWGHKLELKKDIDKLWKNLSSSKRRNIKKAQREDITVAFHEQKSAVQEFYRLHCITRKRHGLPPQPVSFFDAVYENIIAQKQGEVALAYSEKIPVAGAVFLFCEKEVLFKFGASDKNLQHMRSNDLIMWEGIKRFSEKGFISLSFGKTEKFHEGLCRYKDGFGGTRFQMSDHIYKVISGKKLTEYPKVHGFHNLIFRKMPVPLLRTTGELLYKYSA